MSKAVMTVCLIMCIVWKPFVNTFKVTLKLGICSFIIKISLNLYCEFNSFLALTNVPISYSFSVLLCICCALIFVEATWRCGKSMEMGKGILVLHLVLPLPSCVTLDKSLKLQICSPEDWTSWVYAYCYL